MDLILRRSDVDVLLYLRSRLNVFVFEDLSNIFVIIFHHTNTFSNNILLRCL